MDAMKLIRALERFGGVLSGAVAFGLNGVFVGPTLLAAAYRLIDEWLASLPTE